jgi:hypothetical protein
MPEQADVIDLAAYRERRAGRAQAPAMAAAPVMMPVLVPVWVCWVALPVWPVY